MHGLFLDRKQINEIPSTDTIISDIKAILDPYLL